MPRFTKPIFSTVLSLLLITTSLNAQFSPEVKEQFKKIMLAFPDGFTSIKGAQVSPFEKTLFYSKLLIPGAKYSNIIMNEVSGKLKFDATIMANEEDEFKVFEKVYDQWKANIDKLDINGAKLVDYPTDKYGPNGSDMYAKGKAWRLDGSSIGLDPKYKEFTIRLELLDLDEGGFMVKLLIAGE